MPGEEKTMAKKKKSLDLHWVKNHFYLICCDCGLRHHVIVDKEVSRDKNGTPNLAENDQWLALRYYRDDISTQRRRKQKGIEIRIRGKKLNL